MSPGRPSKYDPSMCDEVIKLGKEGKSLVQMASALGVSRDTLHQWTRDEDKREFSDALVRAREESQAWWEEQNRLGLFSKDFNAAAFKVGAQARFPADYRDKQQIEHVGANGGPIETVDLSDTERARRVAFLLAKGVQAQKE